MAVDAYCLLHLGSYGCARELVEGEPTDRHVQYCMGRIDLLLAAGVRPVVVFDGGRLPNKVQAAARGRGRAASLGCTCRLRAVCCWGQVAPAPLCLLQTVAFLPWPGCAGG